MAELAKKGNDNLNRIKDNINNWREYFHENNLRFNRHKRFLFYSTMTADDRALLNKIGQPQIECNLLEVYASRQRGEFSKQEPSIEVSADFDHDIDTNVLEYTEGYFRYLEYEARKDGTAYNVITDMIGGGFSAFKVWTEYSNEKSFHQDIRIGWKADPTMCGFDPMATLSHKADGRYCFDIFTKSKTEFEEEYPNIDLSEVSFNRSFDNYNWSYETNKEKIILVCDYYEKKKKQVVLVELAKTPALFKFNIPTIMTIKEYEQLKEIWEDNGIIEQFPIIKNKRKSTETCIVRYRLIENQILEYEETDYMYLPFVFADANSVVIKETDDGDVKQVTRSSIYNAIGAQKLANVALQSAGNELSNMMQTKIMIGKESICVEQLDGLLNSNIPNILVHNMFLDREGVDGGTVPLSPPQVIARPPMPPEILQTLQLSFTLIQNILGACNSELGVNNNDLSGVAMMEAITQSNATAMPVIVGYMQAYNQVATIVVDLIPKYLISERTIAIVDRTGKKKSVKINGENDVKLHYGQNALHVNVEAGVNFQIQKSRTMQQLIALMRASPLFAEFMNTKGLPILLKNIDIIGGGELKIAAEQFMQEKQQQVAQQQLIAQQQMQNNPQMMKAQTDQGKLQLDAQKMQLDAQQSQLDAQLKASQLEIDQQKADNERLNILANIEESKRDALVAMDKHETEKSRTAADVAMNSVNAAHSQLMEIHNMQHNHSIDKATLEHKVLDTVLKHSKDNGKVNDEKDN